MEILDKDVKEFQAVYKSKFGRDLDYQTARYKLNQLVSQMAIVYQPIKKEQLEELVIREAIKNDAEALAKLVYDIYKEKKQR